MHDQLRTAEREVKLLNSEIAALQKDRSLLEEERQENIKERARLELEVKDRRAKSERDATQRVRAHLQMPSLPASLSLSPSLTHFAHCVPHALLPFQKQLQNELNQLEKSIGKTTTELEQVTPQYDKEADRERKVNERYAHGSLTHTRWRVLCGCSKLALFTFHSLTHLVSYSCVSSFSRLQDIDRRVNQLYSKQGRSAQFKNKKDRDAHLNNEIKQLNTQIKALQDQVRTCMPETACLCTHASLSSLCLLYRSLLLARRSQRVSAHCVTTPRRRRVARAGSRS